MAGPSGNPGRVSRLRRSPKDELPDVRDGLTRLERVILFELAEAQRELEGGHVPSALLYGRVVVHLNVSVPEFERALARLVAR